MAQRRMFSPDIVTSDAFLEMPTSSRELYFQLGMKADDDGFVNPRGIMRMTGSSEDDLKILIGKRFVLIFENGVLVIKHWKINNLVRKDWYKPTQYIDQRKKLFIKKNGSYTEDSSQGIPFVNDSSTQVRLGKVKEYTEKISENKEMKEYNEKNSSDSYEDVIDLDSNEVVPKNTPKNAQKAYQEMIKWSEGRRRAPFLKQSILKQFKAFSVARDNNIQPKDLRDRWEEMEDDKFWSKNGFDWMDVVNSFNRKPVEK